ncbi:N-acetyltransferase 9-like protein isoform X3 [Hylaeus volcanicus]|uniref:N-acetyltransferase 9-like protein isoform X3 n=1 Tax=Hylaeus volcanicus TaxID=313075 RepID=UPI0023B7C593|nr:N-acetyltransferase 9-like protein isoform X3 [Hylaeus volcanicus]
MRINEFTKIIGTNVILVPYKKKHVKRYHEWMKSAELRYFTGSEALTLEEEFQMQHRWHQDENKCTFIILEKSIFSATGNEIEAMIGDTNLFFNETDQPRDAEIEIMIADVAYRGKKRGWEALILMLLYGIDTLNVFKYTAKIKFDNEKSIKLFENLGFFKVEESQIFQEYTLEKVVNQEWKDCLYSKIMNTIIYEVYNEESKYKIIRTERI